LHVGESFGGFVLVAREENNILGSVVVNKTGMKGYIPENILVFIATHADHRGKGLGKMMMEKTIQHAEGDIALHVEHENPARFLYQKYGFTNKYLEMRYKQPS
jgi:ribosomal protein S18 acetylase RimI-like enzyme